MGHPGNRRLRSMVERQRKAFVDAAKRKEKRKIATDIIQEIQNLQPPGRFLTEDPQGKIGGNRHTNGCASVASGCVDISVLNKGWACVEPDKALTKVMHRLREKETGCGSGTGRQIETQEQQRQKQPAEYEVHHQPETKSVQTTAGLPQLLIDSPTVTNTNTNASTTVPLGAFSNHDTSLGIFSNHCTCTQPPHQLVQTGFFGQIPPESHMSMRSECEISNINVDLDGVLSLLNFAMQNQRAGLTGDTDHGYAEVRHLRRP